ncbi:MAG TPA: L-histidine N(alpha)-methyltransferase [Steroidobacteraceae bacterium]|nr:L-histidine N(alpha)-methyltransferase [Steroidobacteraceae bacterium]
MTPPRHTQSALNRLPADWALFNDVLSGLRATPKRLSSTYLYDERGSQLFDEICELPEYYVTRTETRILQTHARDIAARIGDGALLVELGSGASTKTRLLLDQLPDLSAYVPVDISRSHLQAAAQRIASSYPRLEVLPVCADFTQPFSLPRARGGSRRVVVFFPGSTLGNFDSAAARDLLRSVRRIAGSNGGLLIGYDLVKDPAILRAAYNDRAGVTAAFNLNVLHRLNRDLGADFDPAAFRHDALWVPGPSRIEMHLVSLREQTVQLGDEAVTFAAAERLVTEHCHKYTPQSFAALADEAGWKGERTWTDEQSYFNVQYLR